MAIKNTHPLYDATAEDWVQMNDCFEGQRRIKEKGEVYLSATTAHRIDGFPAVGSNGYFDYVGYRLRAVYPDYVRDSISRLIGMMHAKPAKIELPPQLEPMRERGTVAGESLQMLLRRINEAQLRTGRIGLLLDAPSGQGPIAVPFIASYDAETIINWHVVPNPNGGYTTRLVVLDESGWVMSDDLEWTRDTKYRVVRISESGKYEAAVGREEDVPPDMTFITPKIAGKELDGLPFVFVNAVDLDPDPMRPPLLGLSNICLTIYRGEADYRQSLFMQGQDTLVVIGAKVKDGTAANQTRVGAGARLDIPVGGDAKYIGVSSAGLPEQRQALENDREQADKAGASILNFTDSTESSGVALETRTVANTASAIGIARTGAEGLARILKRCAAWVGANPDLVVVEPNTDFKDVKLTGKELLEFITAKQAGAVISHKTIHNQMAERDLTVLSFEEELEEIQREQENPLLQPPQPEDDVEPEDDDGNSSD